MSKTAKNWISRGITAVIIAALIGAVIWLGPVVLSRYRHNAAQEAIEQGRIEYAIELLLPELERKPGDIGLRMKLIDLYMQLENYARVEYLLVHGMREQGGQTELYRMLCDVYVRQDKLLDAVSLLNNLPNPRVQEELDAERPDPPRLTPSPGDFRESLSIEAAVNDGEQCYITLSGVIPSIEKDAYSGPMSLPQGQSEVRAVAVGPNGLVSDWASGIYMLDDVLEVVEFSEPAIEAQTRILIDRPEGDIISGMLQGITELEIPEQHGYKTLDDLRWFTGLTRLELYGSDTHTDISAIGYLANLKDLKLNGLGIDSMDLEVLGQMDWLVRLDLSTNQIATLGFLSELHGLTSLLLSENNITDLSPLAGLTALTELDLRQNGVEETLPIENLTGLTTLNLQGNRVRDLQGLVRMKSLRALNLSHNSIASLEPLSGLTGLTALDLSRNKELYHLDELSEEETGSAAAVGDATPVTHYNSLSPLRPLVNLRSLALDACGIGDITPLAPLVKLEKLSLNDNNLDALTGVEEMVEMKELSADRNGIKSLIPLQGMSRLEILHIEYNGMPSLVAITQLPSLKAVYAFGNPLSENVTFAAPNVQIYKG